MDPIDFDALSEAPYRLPSRHPAAGRGMRRVHDDDRDLSADAPSTPSAAAPASGDASELRRRQEALLVPYLLHRPARY
jgi:hypothetical protein